MATAQPQWRAPQRTSDQANLPSLVVYNSLTRKKDAFVPIEGRKVGWYACGPTVYDDAHLGHARNYVSNDIIRRIMSDYFKFDVSFVMNITDVDDKIILEGRKRYLLEQFLENHDAVDEEVRRVTREAYEAYVEKQLPLLKDSKPSTFLQVEKKAYGHVLSGKALEGDGPPGDREAKVKMHLDTMRAAAEVLALPSESAPGLEAWAEKASGVLKPYLDKKYAHTIDGRKQHDIFTKLTKLYEKRFFEDMERLNVRTPDKLVRVTEYGQKIVDFVKQIQDNGYAYDHEGSVYYDTTAWEKSGGVYARLQPWNRNDQELQADGEGSLSANATSFKKSNSDFALWKGSKPGEPVWDSPWGAGRPGWHIECSAMASDVLGKQMDIHSGGIDLAFPHHDNELAQSEAYHHKCGAESEQWVNYFLHMGHLHISGSKMSKSLKNFTTIKTALDRGDYTPRQMRIIFLRGAWKDQLEIDDDMRKAGRSWEERIDNFFIKVRDIQSHPSKSHSHGTNGTSTPSSDLDGKLEEAKTELHKALLDSFDTPAAMRIISDLIGAYNSATYVPDETSLAIGKWVTEILVMFGLDSNYRRGEIGWSGVDIPEKAKAFIYPLSELRDEVRKQAIEGNVDIISLGRLDEKDNYYNDDQKYARASADFQRKLYELYTKNAQPKSYLEACDELRNTTLWNLGIYLEDRENKHALVRPVSASLREEREDKERRAAEKAAAKAQAQADKAKADAGKAEKAKIDPLTMFQQGEYAGKYKAYDEKGVPTHDAEGKEIAKAQTKKLTKLWEAQKKLFEKAQA
ncbi:hypothetical protein BST61_g1752 [Cercospora zeina]